MPLQSLILNGRRLWHAGTLDNPRLLVVVGRSNLDKPSLLIDAMLWQLHAQGWTLLWYESAMTATARQLTQMAPRWLARVARWPVPGKDMVRKLVRGVCLLTMPRHWYYFWPRARSVPAFVADFRRFLHHALPGRPVCVLAHSAGGRIVSLAADEPSLRRIVCFGYPFCHPLHGEAQVRTAHLATLATPMLIVQGRHDEYGGAEVAQRYELSAAIEILPIDADHDYLEVSRDDWQRVMARIAAMLEEDGEGCGQP